MKCFNKVCSSIVYTKLFQLLAVWIKYCTLFTYIILTCEAGDCSPKHITLPASFPLMSASLPDHVDYTWPSPHSWPCLARSHNVAPDTDSDPNPWRCSWKATGAQGGGVWGRLYRLRRPGRALQLQPHPQCPAYAHPLQTDMQTELQ